MKQLLRLLPQLLLLLLFMLVEQTMVMLRVVILIVVLLMMTVDDTGVSPGDSGLGGKLGAICSWCLPCI